MLLESVVNILSLSLAMYARHGCFAINFFVSLIYFFWSYSFLLFLVAPLLRVLSDILEKDFAFCCFFQRNDFNSLADVGDFKFNIASISSLGLSCLSSFSCPNRVVSLRKKLDFFPVALYLAS